MEWQSSPLPEASALLESCTLQDVDGVAFVDTVARVAEGTLDRAIHEEREQQGAREARLRLLLISTSTAF